MSNEFTLNSFDFVADPSLPAAVPMLQIQFKVGDLAQHPDFPGWIFAWTGCHNNPRVGWWELVFILEGAVWPRRPAPEIGSHHELGYSTLDPISEMEVLALAAK